MIGDDLSAPVDLHLLRPRHLPLIEQSTLAGARQLHRAVVNAMYRGLEPSQHRRLRAARARQAIDVIDLFHHYAKGLHSTLSAHDQVLLRDLDTMTTKLLPKLRAIANLG